LINWFTVGTDYSSSQVVKDTLSNSLIVDKIHNRKLSNKLALFPVLIGQDISGQEK